MKLDIRTVDDVTILTPKAMLLGGQETDDLRNKILELDAAGSERLLLNLGKVEHASTPGLQALYLAHQKYVKRGAVAKICCVDRRMKAILDIVGLAMVYGDNLHEDEAEALAAFHAAPTGRKE